MSNQAQALNALFKPSQGPQILSVDTADNSVLITLHVPDQLSWFDGHFPEQKVLPGVVQVDWAGKLARALFVKGDAFQQLSNIKFKTMVMPDTAMQLELVSTRQNTALNLLTLTKLTRFLRAVLSLLHHEILHHRSTL